MEEAITVWNIIFCWWITLPELKEYELDMLWRESDVKMKFNLDSVTNLKAFGIYACGKCCNNKR